MFNKMKLEISGLFRAFKTIIKMWWRHAGWLQRLIVLLLLVVSFPYSVLFLVLVAVFTKHVIYSRGFLPILKWFARREEKQLYSKTDKTVASKAKDTTKSKVVKKQEKNHFSKIPNAGLTFDITINNVLQGTASQFNYYDLKDFENILFNITGHKAYGVQITGTRMIFSMSNYRDVLVEIIGNSVSVNRRSVLNINEIKKLINK